MDVEHILCISAERDRDAAGIASNFLQRPSSDEIVVEFNRAIPFQLKRVAVVRLGDLLHGPFSNPSSVADAALLGRLGSAEPLNAQSSVGGMAVASDALGRVRRRVFSSGAPLRGVPAGLHRHTCLPGCAIVSLTA
jgi:hypothetical protein